MRCFLPSVRPPTLDLVVKTICKDDR